MKDSTVDIISETKKTISKMPILSYTEPTLPPKSSNKQLNMRKNNNININSNGNNVNDSLVSALSTSSSRRSIFRNLSTSNSHVINEKLNNSNISYASVHTPSISMKINPDTIIYPEMLSPEMTRDLVQGILVRSSSEKNNDNSNDIIYQK